MKIKRLFLYLSEQSGHSWMEEINTARINMGKGKRVIYKGGRLDAKYGITVPPSNGQREGSPEIRSVKWRKLNRVNYAGTEYLIFKVGAALKRCYLPEYRFSEYPDFSLLQDISLEVFLSSLDDVYRQVKKEKRRFIDFRHAT